MEAVTQEVSGGADQVAAGEHVSQHQVNTGASTVEVTVNGSHIHIGAVYAHMSVHIVIDGASDEPRGCA